jgi:hypothetical protein
LLRQGPVSTLGMTVPSSFFDSSEKNMFQIYYTNFQYNADELFETIQEAIEFGKSKGFEFQVYLKNKLVAYAEGFSLNVHYID